MVAVNLDDISSDTMDQIKIAQAGDSDDLRVGEQVVAIGNALGYGQSVTTGIVSALDRDIEVSDNYGTVTYEGLIQTDAAINPGNSGGASSTPMARLSASTAPRFPRKASKVWALPFLSTQPPDFAGPHQERESRPPVPRLIRLDQQMAARFGMRLNVPGIYVYKVAAGGPLDQAGLRHGDVILKLDGTDVKDFSASRASS